jgi:hypothetical protein
MPVYFKSVENKIILIQGKMSIKIFPTVNKLLEGLFGIFMLNNFENNFGF